MKNHIIVYDCKKCYEKLICQGCDRTQHDICLKCLGEEDGIFTRSYYVDTFDLDEALR